MDDKCKSNYMFIGLLVCVLKLMIWRSAHVADVMASKRVKEDHETVHIALVCHDINRETRLSEQLVILEQKITN